MKHMLNPVTLLTIGYLLHQYKRPINMKIIVELQDESNDIIYDAAEAVKVSA